MNKTRLEAFSDGVIAIIVTIMVLELKVPHSHKWEDVHPLIVKLVCYIISFATVAVYWVNHHHMLNTVKRVTGKILWCNLLFLLCLSFMPFTTLWMGEEGFEKIPVIIYAVSCLLCGSSYNILANVIMRRLQDNKIAEALQKQSGKGIISVMGYVASIGFAFFQPYIAIFLFIAIPAMWIIPDKNIEKALEE